MADRSGHPEWETLHAFRAGEVDPAVRAVIDAHLATCEPCRAKLRQVSAVQSLLRKSEPPPLDDLAWHRLAKKIQLELEQRAAQDLPGPQRPLFGWLVPIAVTGAVLLLIVFSSPRNIRRSAPAVEAQPVPQEQRIASPEPVAPNPRRALAARLALRGAALRLSEDARVSVVSVGDLGAEVELLAGELAIEGEVVDGAPEVLIRTPTFTVRTRSPAFSVGLVGARAYVTVREGHAEITTALGAISRVEAGERRELPDAAPPERPKAELAPIARAPAAPMAEAPETSIEVVPPLVPLATSDPIAEDWRAAQAANDRGDRAEAAFLAERVVATGRDRAEAHAATELLCELHIALRQPDQAVSACLSALESQDSPERRQRIHQRLGAVLANQLGDCERAVTHFGQAIVFGRGTLLDQEGLLGRADCELRLGHFGAAERDLGILDQIAGPTTESAAYFDLKKRLEAANRRPKETR